MAAPLSDTEVDELARIWRLGNITTNTLKDKQLPRGSLLMSTTVENWKSLGISQEDSMRLAAWAAEEARAAEKEAKIADKAERIQEAEKARKTFTVIQTLPRYDEDESPRAESKLQSAVSQETFEKARATIVQTVLFVNTVNSDI